MMATNLAPAGIPAMPADPTPTADHPDETPARVPLPPTVAHHAREGAGTVVAGRYKLLECVGEGGMGAVWSAQQTAPVKRLVAVKLIKAGIDSKGVLARFEAERQALAVMDHPNIAKILDGGVTDSGSPFFVMELVKGVPITHYCDGLKLTPAQRLELFVPVCEAIQHAHQKGVIHRDIKPSNVLVALQDGRPVPKVIDFGIAKATGAALTDLTLNTGVGGIVGTPQYMSPEQASLTGLDIDTRSDVYSLGVLLYELLAGSPPFQRRDLEKAGLLEILRVVRDEEPLKPSTKLSTADGRADLSASRGTEPKALTGLLRSELDWVVMKALEKDRTRRYDTPTSFAADVRRYLAGEAVLAHPPSVAYKLRKFLRKNRGPVAAASLVALALVAGVVGTSVGQYRAEQARALAETRREQAEAAEALAETRLGEARASRARAMATLRAMTGDDVEKLIGARKGLGPNERAYLEAIIVLWQDFAKAGGDTPEGRAAAGEGEFRVAVLRHKLGEGEAALAGYRRAVAIYEQLPIDFPGATDSRVRHGSCRGNLGILLNAQGKPAEAEAEYRAALAIFTRVVADSPGAAAARVRQANCRINLGNLLSGRGDLTAAEAEYRAAVAILLALVADSPAEPEYRSQLATARNYLGGLYETRSQRPEAETEFRAALAIEQKLAADFPAVPKYRTSLGGTSCNFGRFLHAGGAPEASLPWYDRAVATLTASVGQQPEDATARTYLGTSHIGRAKAYEGLKRYPEVAEELARAIELSPADERPNRRAGRATALHLAGQHAEAVAEVAELSKSDGWEDTRWYDFACVYAVASGKVAGKREEYAGRAVELLGKAVASGFKESGHVAQDSDFDPLRGRADFRKLVADLEAKHPRPAELAPPPRPAK